MKLRILTLALCLIASPALSQDEALPKLTSSAWVHKDNESASKFVKESDGKIFLLKGDFTSDVSGAVYFCFPGGRMVPVKFAEEKTKAQLAAATKLTPQEIKKGMTGFKYFAAEMLAKAEVKMGEPSFAPDYVVPDEYKIKRLDKATVRGGFDAGLVGRQGGGPPIELTKEEIAILDKRVEDARAKGKLIETAVKISLVDAKPKASAEHTLKAADPEKESASLLAFAKILKSQNKTDSAKAKLETILKDYPKTEAAKEAETLLKDWQK